MHWQFVENLNLLKVFFVVLLISIPLYPKFPLFGVEGTYVAIRVEDWLVLFTVILWFFWQARKGFPVLEERVFWLFVLFWLVGVASSLSALLITDIVSSKLLVLHFLRRVEYMIVFFVAADAFRFMKKKEFTWVLSLVLVLVFVYGIGQKYLGFPVVSTMNEEFSKGILLRLDKWVRISSTFAGHYDLAAWLVMVVPVVLAITLQARNRLEKAIGFLIAFLGFHLLVLTASRISFFAYLIGVSFFLLLIRRFLFLGFLLVFSLFWGLGSKELNLRLVSTFKFIPYSQRYLTGLPDLIASRLSFESKKPLPTPTPRPTPTVTLSPTPTLSYLLSVKKGPGESGGGVALPTPTPPPKVSKKVFREVRTWPKPEEIEVAAARSSQIRFKVEWPRAARSFLKNPLLGTGYSSLGLATDNDYLRLLGETGILGFLSFGLIIFHLFFRLFGVVWKRKSLFLAGFLGAMVGFLANALFIDVFEASKDAFYFWILMGVAYRLSSKGKV